MSDRSKERKLVVIGLDGVPFSLLGEYMQMGLMPELTRLCHKGGQLLKMKSTLPEISSVAWTSFMTGKNPGEHGIFGFMDIDRKTYEYSFLDFDSLKERPVWERKEIKTVVVNLPQTYPARSFQGVMVSGFVALDLKKATYPERIYNYLERIGYRLDVDTALASKNPEAFFTNLFDTFRKRTEVIEHLYENEDWQLFIGAITETDRLHHFFFDSARGGTYFYVYEQFYRELDRFIGSMADKAERDGAVFLTCSDHGFAPIKTEVYINKWLMENGYLELDGYKGLAGITSNSKVFCLDPSRIHIHLDEIYSRGPVNISDYNVLVDEVKHKLNDLTFEGQKVIKQIYLREEIFHGKFMKQSPDIYLLPRLGFDLKGAVGRPDTFGLSRLRGMHTYDDAHLFSSIPVEDSDLQIETLGRIMADYLEPKK